jgi:hypothetical protein
MIKCNSLDPIIAIKSFFILYFSKYRNIGLNVCPDPSGVPIVTKVEIPIDPFCRPHFDEYGSRKFLRFTIHVENK